MIDIIMVSCADWHISRLTKYSLMKYANNDRVILQCEPDYYGKPDCTFPILDTIKIDIIRTKATSEFIYILDDDDWLLRELEPLADGYDGAIYNAHYKGENLIGVDKSRIGVAFGYIRCLFRREFLLSACDIAEKLDLKTCFDVFLFYYLAIDGCYVERDYRAAAIDHTPRTMNNNKFGNQYAHDLHKIKRYFSL